MLCEIGVAVGRVCAGFVGIFERHFVAVEYFRCSCHGVNGIAVPVGVSPGPIVLAANITDPYLHTVNLRVFFQVWP